jgi:hypothetical protein
MQLTSSLAQQLQQALAALLANSTTNSSSPAAAALPQLAGVGPTGATTAMPAATLSLGSSSSASAAGVPGPAQGPAGAPPALVTPQDLSFTVAVASLIMAALLLLHLGEQQGVEHSSTRGTRLHV